MKGVAQILWYFLTWQRTMALVAGAGVVMMLVAVPLYLFVSEPLWYFPVLLTIVFVFVFPVAAAPLAFRELIANRRMSLLPGFPVRAGMALLLLVISFSVSGFVALVLIDDVSSPWIAPVTLFAWASIYVGLMQLFLTFRFMRFFLQFFWLAWLFVMGTELSMEPLARFWLDDRTLLVSHGVGILGWIPAIMILSGKHRFRPVAVLTDDRGKRFGRNMSWTIHLGDGLMRRVAQGFLLGYPDSLMSRLLVMLERTVLPPAIAGLLFHLLYSDPGEPGNPIRGLVFALFMGVFAVAAMALRHAEAVARCRQLWLRCGGDRMSQWGTLEVGLLPELVLLAGVATVIAAVVSGLDLLPGLAMLHYVLLVIGTGLFYTYLGLAIRITHHFSVVVFVLLMLSFIILLAGIGVSAASGSSVMAAGIEAGLLAMALLLRHVARRGFGRIDWLSLRSRSLSAHFSTV